MINLFVEFGIQPLNVEALLDFELIERSIIINNFEARNITIIVTIFRKTKMLDAFSKNCHDNCDVSCFKIIDNATSFYQLKIKESFHIERLKPELNKQVDHVSLALHFKTFTVMSVVFSIILLVRLNFTNL